MTVWQRMWSGRGWRGVLRRAVSAGVLALLASVTVAAPVTALKAEQQIALYTQIPGYLGPWSDPYGASTWLAEAGSWLTTRGEMTPYRGVVWSVSHQVEGSVIATEFFDEAEARQFAVDLPGATVDSYWRADGGFWTFGQVLGELDGSPMVEVAASNGQVIYASPTVRGSESDSGAPLTPSSLYTADTGDFSTETGIGVDRRLGDLPWTEVVVTCAGTLPADELPYGEGVLRETDSLPPGTTFRVCTFRSAAMVAQMRQEIWRSYTTAVATAVVALAASTLILVGSIGAMGEHIRRRALMAAAADLPELVSGSGPMAGLTDGVNVSLARARSAVEQQRGFVADAAHELRSPLSSLITTLEVAERYPHLTDQRSVTAASLKQARRIERLTQDLLTLAQVDARAPVRQDTVALDDVIREVADDHRGQGREVRIDAPAPATVVGDPEALRRVLANLVGNAVRHARREVTITLLTWPDRVDVTVADDGSGIAATDRERIFDRFTRLDEARGRDAGGSGLGLSIARELARRHGGDVTLDRPGRTSGGAVFRLTLPTAR